MTLPYPLNQEDLRLVKNDILEAFEPHELMAFRTFNDFWAAVETWQAYEEDWESEKEYWRPYYFKAFEEIKNILAR